ncbi:MAG TPA: hypothetical protein VFC38_12910 [Stellaceae bacterium]|nr:hypothetical protein [Stellaceae bacterium]
MSADLAARGAGAARLCRSCTHFRNDPAYLERALPGLNVLSSGYASVRGEDGLCLKHDRFTGPRDGCADFTPRAGR